MNKVLIFTVAGAVVVAMIYVILSAGSTPVNDQTIDCLADAGVVIYGSATCPACIKLVEDFGGNEIINPIYVNCTENPEKCRTEMQTNYVPEIQIKGVLYDGARSPEVLAEEVGCNF